jgi:hypothetical protein
MCRFTVLVTGLIWCDLSFNKLGNAGLEHLSRALGDDSPLLIIDLRHNGISLDARPKGLVAPTRHIFSRELTHAENARRMREYDVSYAAYEAAAAAALTERLLVQEMTNSLRSNHTLQHVDLRGNTVDPALQLQLDTYLLRNRQLPSLAATRLAQSPPPPVLVAPPPPPPRIDPTKSMSSLRGSSSSASSVASTPKFSAASTPMASRPSTAPPSATRPARVPEGVAKAATAASSSASASAPPKVHAAVPQPRRSPAAFTGRPPFRPSSAKAGRPSSAGSSLATSRASSSSSLASRSQPVQSRTAAAASTTLPSTVAAASAGGVLSGLEELAQQDPEMMHSLLNQIAQQLQTQLKHKQSGPVTVPTGMAPHRPSTAPPTMQSPVRRAVATSSGASKSASSPQAVRASPVSKSVKASSSKHGKSKRKSKRTGKSGGQWLDASEAAQLQMLVDSLSVAFHRLRAVTAHVEAGNYMSPAELTRIMRDTLAATTVMSPTSAQAVTAASASAGAQQDYETYRAAMHATLQASSDAAYPGPPTHDMSADDAFELWRQQHLQQQQRQDDDAESGEEQTAEYDALDTMYVCVCV